MWLITPVGFFSVVRKPTDVKAGTLTVRARVQTDLEQLKAGYLPELGTISESRTTDYRYRAVAPQAAMAGAVARLVSELDYDNFKNTVAQRQGRARADLYHDVWSALYELQRQPKHQPRAALHPKRDDQGQQVLIRGPSSPSSQAAWKLKSQIAAVTPGGKLPASLHRVRFDAWKDAPTTTEGWEAMAAESEVPEPAFKAPKGLSAAAGVVVRESDGRIWMMCPTNQFGGHEVTFPKGRTDGKSLQATALCEGYEESGLRLRLVCYLIDVQRTQTYTRYYLAERIGGSPTDMGWESQRVMLVPQDSLDSLDLAPADHKVLKALAKTARL